MKRITTLFTLSLMLASMMGMGQTAYITNPIDSTVLVINVATNTVVDTIALGGEPFGVSVSADGSKVYVTNNDANGTVSVINTAANTVSATIPVGFSPNGISVSPDGNKVYVTNYFSNTVSVINTVTNTVSATIAVGSVPWGVCVSPDGSKVYVTNNNGGTVSIINTSVDTVSAIIAVGNYPYPAGVCVSPDGSKVYVVKGADSTVSIINTTTNTVTTTITVGTAPLGVCVSPDGSKVYVVNYLSNTVSVINTVTNTVWATIAVGKNPFGVSVSPDGSEVYATNETDNTVSVINTATNTVSNTITVGHGPIAFGNFISTHTYTPFPIANFQSSASTICANDCINFTDLSTNAASWQWSFAGAADSTSTAQNPQYVCYEQAGIYNVTLIVSNAGGSDSVTFSNYITVNPAPPPPSIQDHPGIGNDTLFFTTQPGYTYYQWLLDSALLPNATDTFLIVFKSGDYNVKVTNANGCKTAAGINVTVGLQNYMSDHIISLSPNPATNKLVVHGYSLLGKAMLKIYNFLGEVCQQSEIVNRKSEIEMDVSSLPTGIYFVQILTERERWVGKFVKE